MTVPHSGQPARGSRAGRGAPVQTAAAGHRVDQSDLQRSARPGTTRRQERSRGVSPGLVPDPRTHSGDPAQRPNWTAHQAITHGLRSLTATTLLGLIHLARAPAPAPTPRRTRVGTPENKMTRVTDADSVPNVPEIAHPPPHRPTDYATLIARSRRPGPGPQGFARTRGHGHRALRPRRLRHRLRRT
jgi:hypothetical protein